MKAINFKRVTGTIDKPSKFNTGKSIGLCKNGVHFTLTASDTENLEAITKIVMGSDFEINEEEARDTAFCLLSKVNNNGVANE